MKFLVVCYKIWWTIKEMSTVGRGSDSGPICASEVHRLLAWIPSEPP